VEEPHRVVRFGLHALMSPSSIRDTVGTLALGWLEREFSRLDVFRDLVANHPDEARQTAVCEAALAILVLDREGRISGDGHGGRLADYVLRVYQRPAFHTYVFDGHPLAFTGHLIAWLVANTLSDSDSISREQMQGLIDTDRFRLAERPAFRAIELRYFLDWGSFRHALPEYHSLFEETWLAGVKPCPSEATVDDVYAATHTVFYVTDFGRRLPAFLGITRTDAIRARLRQCLDLLVESRHWDLVAEVLLSLQCLGAGDTVEGEQAWQALHDAQDPTGAFFEGPSGERLEPIGSELEPSEFLVLYHRALTVVLAAFVGRGQERLR
jgi:hypothetical protein